MSNVLSETYSAVIIARNEERTIGKCITALQEITDDIVVVLDDRTTDKTAIIAKSLHANVITKKWEGFSANKNFGALQAKNDWILCLDADEIIDNTIIGHINHLAPQNHTVYEMNILTYVGETPIKHGGWHPDWNIRLYNRTIMQWNDHPIHEKLIPKNHTSEIDHKRMKGIVHHYSFIDWAHMDIKYDEYARLRAEGWKSKNRQPFIAKKWFGPGFRFFKTYILRVGFLDGIAGFQLAKREFILKRKEWMYYKK